MEEITFQVVRDAEPELLVASWDAPDNTGGITTQGEDLSDLQHPLTAAVNAYFDDGESPRRIRIHFVSDPVLVQA